jgi:hypothetical protein
MLGISKNEKKLAKKIEIQTDEENI